MPWEPFEYCETDTTIPSKLFIMDEYASFMDVPDRDMEKKRLRSQIETNLQQIARLGRSQHIHMILCTQTMTRDLFNIDLRNNIGHRICCGAVEDNVSQMIMDSSEASTIPQRPGAAISWTLPRTQQFQSYFIKDSQEVLKVGTLKDDEEDEEVKPSQDQNKATETPDTPQDEEVSDNTETTPQIAPEKPLEEAQDTAQKTPEKPADTASETKEETQPQTQNDSSKSAKLVLKTHKQDSTQKVAHLKLKK